MSIDEERLANERDFHNQIFSDDGLHSAGRVVPRYAITQASNRFFEDAMARLAPGKHVLEYGCGVNSYAIWLARMGATVIGIDISDQAVDYSRERALREGVSDKVQFVRMNAEELEFAPATFNLVCGRAILHHLDLARAYPSLARTMTDDAKAVFVEPMGYNPLLNLFRAFTPDERTPDEHPFRNADFALTDASFASVERHYFHLTSMGAMAFYKFPKLFGSAVNSLDKLDQALFKTVPQIGKLAWSVGLVLSSPKQR